MPSEWQVAVISPLPLNVIGSKQLVLFFEINRQGKNSSNFAPHQQFLPQPTLEKKFTNASIFLDSEFT